jgi:signal transduction histidine kinase
MPGKSAFHGDAAARAERVDQAYANEGIGHIGTSAGGCIYALVMARAGAGDAALPWLAALLGITALRLFVRGRWRRYPVSRLEAARWARVFRAGAFLSGAAWGSTALFLFPGADPSHQMFTAFMVGGVVAGAAAAYAPLEGAFACFAVPAMLPLFAATALSGDPLHRGMAVLMAVYALVMILISRNVRASAWSAVWLKLENRDLADGLSRAMRETLDLNASLKAEIRQRERTQAELHEHRAHLEAVVAQRTDELSRANRDLRRALEEKTRIEEERKKLEDQLLLARKMESLATLAGGVAHDFNNLLMGIGGQLSLILAGRRGDDPDIPRLEAMERQVREGAELTRQLLGLAMGGRYEVKPVGLNDVAGKVAGLFARTHREVRVAARLGADVPRVDADRGQLEQALLNICLNAAQAMPGGGTVDISTRRARVAADRAAAFGVRPGDFAVVAVADTGAGMDRSLLPRIFDPFFTTRGPGEGARQGRPGAGLGLSSAYGIVRNHGGFIDVDTEPGRGSTFSIHLPESTLPAAEPAGPAAEGRAGRKTVLVVDDEPAVAEVASLMLRRLGLEVHKAQDGPAALELYRERAADIDLVLLDMVMPGMGGEEVFRRLNRFDPGVRVLLSSGYSREGRAQDLLKAGCLGFLQKPYNLAELRARLEEILGPLVLRRP